MVESWIDSMETLFEDLYTLREGQVPLATHCLEKAAKVWGSFSSRLRAGVLHIIDCVPDVVRDDADRAEWFLRGLRPWIYRAVQLLKLTTFAEVFDRALWAEHGDATVREEASCWLDPKTRGRSGRAVVREVSRVPRGPRNTRSQSWSRGPQQCAICGAGGHRAQRVGNDRQVLQLWTRRAYQPQLSSMGPCHPRDRYQFCSPGASNRRRTDSTSLSAKANNEIVYNSSQENNLNTYTIDNYNESTISAKQLRARYKYKALNFHSVHCPYWAFCARRDRLPDLDRPRELQLGHAFGYPVSPRETVLGRPDLACETGPREQYFQDLAKFLAFSLGSRSGPVPPCQDRLPQATPQHPLMGLVPPCK
uniref:Uncharacterized protein n=1 Tax=Ananas comosus var. bracteatus TaxID=296719 RepID=A0A6V7PSK7_ANACO|nr:unnamed protein product [Ananas comosus var. bracteatus]